MELKPWMKILIWLGLGGGIGFFAGYGIGTMSQKKRDNTEARQEMREARDAWERNLKVYRGEEELEGADTDGDCFVGEIPTEIDLSDPARLQRQLAIEEDPGEGSVDIPDLHPENMLPEPITEEEWNRNEWGYDLEDMDFYEYDEVLFNPRTQMTENPDEVLGIGATFGFAGDPDNPTEVIYIRNDTMGTLYRVTLIHAAYIDEMDDTMAPVEDSGEEAYGSGDTYDEDDESEEEW